MTAVFKTGEYIKAPIAVMQWAPRLLINTYKSEIRDQIFGVLFRISCLSGPLETMVIGVSMCFSMKSM